MIRRLLFLALLCAAGVADTEARVARFAADWRAAAARVKGKGRRALHELFGHAGFEVVADHDGIRNFRPGKPGVPIVPLDGPLFTHPGPGLLDGLEQLRLSTEEIAQ